MIFQRTARRARDCSVFRGRNHHARGRGARGARRLLASSASGWRAPPEAAIPPLSFRGASSARLVEGRVLLDGRSRTPALGRWRGTIKQGQVVGHGQISGEGSRAPRAKEIEDRYGTC